MLISAGCAIGQAHLILHVFGPFPGWDTLALMAFAAAALPALIIYGAVEKLTGQILALQKSTKAIAAGDMNRPAEVDCACEVGLLADSFRKMADRLNANIQRMNALAHRDSVTGLPNRAALDQLLSRAAKENGGFPGGGVSLFFIDLDGFKSVNDALGHASGDELLRQVSHRVAQEVFGRDAETMATCSTAYGELCEACPEEVVFARFAGDEFVALIPGEARLPEIEETARAMTACLARPFFVDGAEIHVTASVGVARGPTDSTDPRELLRFADIAMFEAKQRGKNNHVLFDQSLRACATERRELEAELRLAIETGALSLHFQPKLESRHLSISGVEALLRWSHPERGMIPPGKFIPVAERAGLMPALGKVVFSLALEQCRKWQDRGLRMPVAINVSAAQFDDPHFAEDLLALVRAKGVDPALVEVEITETMVMTDFHSAAKRVSALREAGLAIAIDDFGVGFSNLSQLAKLPVNFIKIDRSLTESIGADRKAETILRATINMAHALGYATIAEGIETDEQSAFLRFAGCDTMQGFLFARPMPAAEFERWMEKRGRSALPKPGSLEEAVSAA